MSQIHKLELVFNRDCVYIYIYMFLIYHCNVKHTVSLAFMTKGVHKTSDASLENVFFSNSHQHILMCIHLILNTIFNKRFNRILIFQAHSTNGLFISSVLFSVKCNGIIVFQLVKY